MDNLIQTSNVPTFRTPPRILIPKLVSSRDKWKARATARKRLFHKQRIRSRDLAASRARWKDRALAAELKVQQLQLQLQRVQADLSLAHADLARLQDESKKK